MYIVQSMSFKKELLDKYVLLLIEYLQLVDASDTLKTMDRPDKIILIGLQSLIHIFKLSILHTQNVEIAFCYCQKGMFCYLEYMEQMTKTNSMHNLENIDAVLFEYNKTLMELYNSKAAAMDGMNGSTSISSLTIKDSWVLDAPPNNHLADFFAHKNTDSKSGTDHDMEWKVVTDHLSQWTKLLLWFERTDFATTDRIQLATEYLKKYAILFTKDNIYLLQVLETIQQKTRLSKENYLGILDEYYAHWKKLQKQKNLPTCETVRDKCIYLMATHPHHTLDEIASEEGYRHVYDVVKFT